MPANAAGAGGGSPFTGGPPVPAPLDDVAVALTEEAWRWIEAAGRRVSFSAGARIAHQGEDRRTVYAISAGRVLVMAVTSKGDELLLAERGPGHTVGELAALVPGSRVASVVAAEPTVAWMLDADQYLRLLHEIPGLAVAQLVVLSARLRDTVERYVARSDDLTSRVAARLLDASGDAPGDAEVVLVQKDLAAWVGATREATVRCLGRLRAAGAVETKRGSITIVDRDALCRFR